MTNIQFIITVFLQFAVAGAIVLLHHRKKRKDSLVELNCEFCLSSNTDELLNTYYEQTGVYIDGLLGNDFMVSHKYIIDYEDLQIKHNSMKISIKDAIEILEIPIIVLWQGRKKLIFILDTGATASSIHSKHVGNGLDFEYIDEQAKIYGFGGSGESSTTIRTKLNYYPPKS